jgi:sugar O-acyltransferase (sialic acid O-acetyltransferase NeuD family)
MNDKLQPMFVFGASGHAKVVIDIIEKQGAYRIAFLADDDAGLKGTLMYGYRIIGGRNELRASQIRQGIIAIGSNRGRDRVAAWLASYGCELVSAIHPSAQIGRGVCMGFGSVVMAGAIINSDTGIGSNAVVNTRASIDHDCIIEDVVHIAPGATLCGNVYIGSGSIIGAGATILPNLRIGSNTIVGAGSTVTGDLPSNCTAVGTPARIIKRT